MERTTMIINSALAKEMLTRNAGNRPIKKGSVRRFAEAMQDGSWRKSTDPIAFDEAGNLINGQHRLMAIVRTGVSLEFEVVYGVNRQEFIFDQGVARTDADVLKLRGVVPDDFTGQPVVATANAFISMIKDPRKTMIKATITEREQCLSSIGGTIAFAVACSSIKDTHSSLKKAYPQAALAAAHLCGVSSSDLQEFCIQYNTLIGASQPVVALHKYISDPKNGSHSEPVRKRMSAVAEMAIDAFVRGKKLRIPEAPKHIYFDELSANKNKSEQTTDVASA